MNRWPVPIDANIIAAITPNSPTNPGKYKLKI